ncbi:hypothetical protein JYU34_016960 [Plutella xylostella]|uniref:Uncharacterized protein n=1 Tax=Plutella xylostella TaxID=51655 RepID=A0ABQ7Q7N6_PLUXY|nr:hypothetical protein JYU34_016960 [Plutella xylostella]
MCQFLEECCSLMTCTCLMLARTFMTMIVMMEHIMRMIIQMFYNFVTFLLQLCSLLPLCCIFLLTSGFKCFVCGSGGACPSPRAGCACSLATILILYLIWAYLINIDDYNAESRLIAFSDSCAVAEQPP